MSVTSRNMFKVLILFIVLAYSIFGEDTSRDQQYAHLTAYARIYQEYENCRNYAVYDKMMTQLRKIIPNFDLAADWSFFRALFEFAAKDSYFSILQKSSWVKVTLSHCPEEHAVLSCKVKLLPIYIECYIVREVQVMKCLEEYIWYVDLYSYEFVTNAKKSEPEYPTKMCKLIKDLRKCLFQQCPLNQSDSILNPDYRCADSSSVAPRSCNEKSSIVSDSTNDLSNSSTEVTSTATTIFTNKWPGSNTEVSSNSDNVSVDAGSNAGTKVPSVYNDANNVVFDKSTEELSMTTTDWTTTVENIWIRPIVYDNDAFPGKELAVTVNNDDITATTDSSAEMPFKPFTDFARVASESSKKLHSSAYFLILVLCTLIF